MVVRVKRNEITDFRLGLRYGANWGRLQKSADLVFAVAALLDGEAAHDEVGIRRGCKVGTGASSQHRACLGVDEVSVLLAQLLSEDNAKTEGFI